MVPAVIDDARPTVLPTPLDATERVPPGAVFARAVNVDPPHARTRRSASVRAGFACGNIVHLGRDGVRAFPIQTRPQTLANGSW
ncbi:MAG: hypothetical protein KatS3mg076_0861 [Candidatus Binatia bacterium]|nr:MAG: hypothetical protein KatS3mg076_0861 [Candidatus Binatia bacterium]